MKKSLLITLFILVSLCMKAQLDLTDYATNNSTGTSIENTEYDLLFYSANFTAEANSAFHTVDLTTSTGPDTIFFPLTIAGEISPSEGLNANHDTLTLEIAVAYWGNLRHNTNSSFSTTDADFTIQNSINSYSSEDISVTSGGAKVIYNDFQFIEGETDTLMVIVTGGLFTFTYFSIRSTNVTVITNLKNDIFGEGGVLISNPIRDEVLNINLPRDIPTADIVLLSLDGEIVASKEINHTDHQVDIANLKGMYILKELSTGSYKKIIIE